MADDADSVLLKKNVEPNEPTGQPDEDLSCWSLLKRPLSPVDKALIESRNMPLPADAVLKPAKGTLDRICERIVRREGFYVDMKIVHGKPAVEVGYRGTF